MSTRFIELAGDINASMPEYVVTKCQELLIKIASLLNHQKYSSWGLHIKKMLMT